MPKYFFHKEGAATAHDSVGVDLRDAGAALAEAMRWAGELLSERPSESWTNGYLRIIVESEGGPILTLWLSSLSGAL